MPRNLRNKIAVIGGGIAGACTSELLSKEGYEVTLFEKSNRLGGCSGSFTREGFIFNVGATTIAGLNEGFPVKKILSNFNIKENIRVVEPSITVHTPKGIIRRFSCLHKTIDEIDRIFPNRGNYKFWNKVYETTFRVLTHDYYHNFSSIKGPIRTFLNMKNLIFRYFRHFLIPAEIGLKEYFPELDGDYYDFMDSYVKIVAQSRISEVSFLTLLLSLGYPFTGVGYPERGMGRLIEEIVRNPLCLIKAEVKSLEAYKGNFILKGDFGEESFQKVILALPVFENMHILKDNKIKDYLEKYIHLNTYNSAVVLYGLIKDFYPDEKFHLKILRESLPHTSSKYLFFSFNTINREKLKYTTFTVSTHTKTSYWINLQRELYDIKKDKLTERILKVMRETFMLKSNQIVQSFMATPETFFKYLGRRSLGGIPVTRKNSFWRIPSNFTPIENFYLAGDSFFCYQGWIGISMGIRNLIENFYEES